MVSADGVLSVTGGGACSQRRCVAGRHWRGEDIEDVIAGISAGVRDGAADIAAGTLSAFESSSSFLEIKPSSLFGFEGGGRSAGRPRSPSRC